MQTSGVPPADQSPPARTVITHCWDLLWDFALSITLSTQLRINKMQNDKPRWTLGKGNGQADRRTYGRTDRWTDRQIDR